MKVIGKMTGWYRPNRSKKRYSSHDMEYALQEYYKQGKTVIELESQASIEQRQKEHYKNYREFYHTPEWKKLQRETVIYHKKNNTYHCAVCKDTHKLVVDHIKPSLYYWELRLEPSNLQILCEDCNLVKLSKEYTDDLKEAMYRRKKKIPTWKALDKPT